VWCKKEQAVGGSGVVAVGFGCAACSLSSNVCAGLENRRERMDGLRGALSQFIVVRNDLVIHR
jgi:hypothetical protein